LKLALWHETFLSLYIPYSFFLLIVVVFIRIVRIFYQLVAMVVFFLIVFFTNERFSNCDGVYSHGSYCTTFLSRCIFYAPACFRCTYMTLKLFCVIGCGRIQPMIQNNHASPTAYNKHFVSSMFGGANAIELYL